MTSAVFAQYVDPQNVLIRNVQLIDRDDDDAKVIVNILIRDNKVEVVTKDEIPLGEVSMAIDGRNGFLLGALVIGEAPKFIILDQDPRENFDVLVNTRPHVLFAVNDGELVKNMLFEIRSADGTAAETPQSRGWMAYTPPPMALPTSYLDNSKWNKWTSKYIDGLFVAGVVLDRQHWISQNDDNRQQVGDVDLFDGGEIRGLRVGAVGSLNFRKPWVYTIFGATNAFDKGFEIQRQDDFALFDYRLDIPVFKRVNLSIGKQKEPISMERIMSMVQLPMQERTSVSDALLPSRNVGVVFSGQALGRRMTWAGGVFNDWFESSDSIGESATQVIGRVTWLPFVSDDESNLVHLGLGIRHSNAKEGVQYLTEPEFNKSPIYVDTGPIDADSVFQYNLEATWRRGPYWLAAEYVGTDVDSPGSGDLEFSGYHVTASWILTGEMRAYNYKSGILGPVPVAKTVYQGGIGAWELGFRYSSLDLSDGPVDGGKMNIVSLGVNWWLTPFFSVNSNYRYIENDKDGFNGESSGWMLRLLLILE
jgi:phosphate-selective porin OprO/OprP